MKSVQVSAFWRVGYRADPLRVLTAQQGSGRFDDPEHLIGVVYVAYDLRTCLRELLRPWPPAPEAEPMLTDIEAPEEPGDAEAAETDQLVATYLLNEARVPDKLYERDVVYAVTATPLELLDLTDFQTMLKLETDADIQLEMRSHGFTQLDIGAITARQEFRPVTQAITNAVVRGSLRNENLQGLHSLSRHDAQPIYAIFQDGRYDDHLRLSSKAPVEVPLTADNTTLIEVATELHLKL